MAKNLIKSLAGMVEGLPERVDVLELRRLTPGEIGLRINELLSATAHACAREGKEGDWVVGDDHTLVRLPSGGMATAHHASGAVSVSAGLAPMKHLFEGKQDRKTLGGLVDEVAGGLELERWVGRDEHLEFERLWTIKAAAAAPRGEMTDPVICRAVGAFRHIVGKLPVWGAASAVVKVAAGGRLDHVSVRVRPTSGEIVDSVSIIRPDLAATQALRQLSGLMAGSETPLEELAKPVSFDFGYFSLGDRKTQSYLAPAYVAVVQIEGEESFNHLVVVGAGEKDYVPFARIGTDPTSGVGPRAVESKVARSMTHLPTH